jgi:hypothetical protein
VMSQARHAIERELPGGAEALETYYRLSLAIALACRNAKRTVSDEAWNWGARPGKPWFASSMPTGENVAGR